MKLNVFKWGHSAVIERKKTKFRENYGPKK